MLVPAARLCFLRPNGLYPLLPPRHASRPGGLPCAKSGQSPAVRWPNARLPALEVLRENRWNSRPGLSRKDRFVRPFRQTELGAGAALPEPAAAAPKFSNPRKAEPAFLESEFHLVGKPFAMFRESHLAGPQNLAERLMD